MACLNSSAVRPATARGCGSVLPLAHSAKRTTTVTEASPSREYCTRRCDRIRRRAAETFVEPDSELAGIDTTGAGIAAPTGSTGEGIGRDDGEGRRGLRGREERRQESQRRARRRCNRRRRRSWQRWSWCRGHWRQRRGSGRPRRGLRRPGGRLVDGLLRDLLGRGGVVIDIGEGFGLRVDCRGASSAAISAARGYRRLGSFSRHRAMIAVSPGGRSLMISSAGVNGS